MPTRSQKPPQRATTKPTKKTKTPSRRPPAQRKPKLTDKQRAFIEAYFACSFNATAAARRAGYGKTYASCRSMGSQNLNHPLIRKTIDARLEHEAMVAGEVLARLTDQARGTMADFLDPDSFSLDLKKARSRSKLHLIKKFKITTRTEDEAQVETIEFELYDAQAALVQLGRVHKLFTDRVEQAIPPELQAAFAELGVKASDVWQAMLEQASKMKADKTNGSG